MANRSITRLIFGILFLCVIGYMTFVFRFYLQKPQILIDQSNYILTDNPIVEISGNTKNIQTLYINSVPVLLDEDNNFSQKRSVSPGISNITIEGVDRFDRSTEISISVERKEVFKAPEAIPESEEEEIDTELEKLTD